MCWRLQATTESLKDPDFTYHFYDIGLISCLELWLGVIVNCMPTLGPLPHAYIKPIISKLRSSVLSGESQYSERGIHLDSLASKVPRRRYYNISSSNHVNTNYAVQTECAYDPNTAPPWCSCKSGRGPCSPGYRVASFQLTQTKYLGNIAVNRHNDWLE